MIIPIDAETRIQGAEMSWDVQKLHVPGESAKNREPRWKTVGYCSTAVSALNNAFQSELRAWPSSTAEQARKASHTLRAKYKPLLALAEEIGRELA